MDALPSLESNAVDTKIIEYYISTEVELINYDQIVELHQIIIWFLNEASLESCKVLQLLNAKSQESFVTQDIQ